MKRFLTWAKQPGPALILAQARDRLERGRGGPTPLRVNLSPAERGQVGELLGLDWQTSDRPVTLPRLRQALAVYRLTLETLLEEVGGPLVDRVAEREAARACRVNQERSARELLAAVIDPALVEQVAAACLPGRNPLPRARQLAQVAAELPAQVHLPVLAARCFGDAHALDRNRALGQAAARLCLLLAGQHVPDGALLAEQWRSAWAGVGVSCDRVSTMVLTLNLPLSGSSAVRAVTGAGGEPVWVTMRLLDQAGPPDPPPREVFVCENPSVLETAADRFGERCAPMVCTFGRPSQAAHILVRLLAGSGTQLWIRADNDPVGRSVVAGLQADAPTARPWRFGPDSPAYEEQLLEDLLTDLGPGQDALPRDEAIRDTQIRGGTL